MNDSSAPAEAPPRRALALLERAIGAVNGVAMAASAASVLASLVLIAWAVVMRYAFSRPPIWADEVVGFLLVGIVMLATAQSLRRGEHIGVDLFTAHLGPRGRLWARLWSLLTVAIVSIILIVNGWQTAMFSRKLGVLTEGNIEMPVFWLQLLLPVGGLMMLLVCLEALLRMAGGAPSLAMEVQHGSREVD